MIVNLNDLVKIDYKKEVFESNTFGKCPIN